MNPIYVSGTVFVLDGVVDHAMQNQEECEPSVCEAKNSMSCNFCCKRDAEIGFTDMSTSEVLRGKIICKICYRNMQMRIKVKGEQLFRRRELMKELAAEKRAKRYGPRK